MLEYVEKTMDEYHLVAEDKNFSGFVCGDFNSLPESAEYKFMRYVYSS